MKIENVSLSDTRRPLNIFRRIWGFFAVGISNGHKIGEHFEKFEIIPGNRSLRQQASVIHKKNWNSLPSLS